MPSTSAPMQPPTPRAQSQSRSRSRTTSARTIPPYHLSDSIASLSARATVAQPGIEAIDSATPLGVDLLYRWDGPNPADDDNSDSESRTEAHPGHVPRQEQQQQERFEPAEEEDHLAWCRHLPWWKRPSDTLLRPFVFLLAMASGLLIPVKVEYYDQLACEQLNLNPTPSVPPPTNPASSWAWLLRGSLTNLAGPHIPYGPDDPTLCHSAPVLTASASLQMRMTVVCGILSVLTTGWWTGRSDRQGRRGVMIWGALGMVANNLNYVLVAMIPRTHLPGGANFLLVGAIFEGLVGGLPTSMASFSAYIADSTPPGTKSVGYSMFLGLFFIALAIGPILGGKLVAIRGLVSVFYVGSAITLVYFAFVLLLLPESCSPDSLAHAKKEHLSRTRLHQAQLDAQLDSAKSSLHKVGIRLYFYLLHVCQPLTVLAPSKVEITTTAPYTEPSTEPSSSLDPNEGSSLFDPSRRASTYSFMSGITSAEANASYISVSRASKKWTRDYNLLLVALALVVETSVIGVMGNKMLYAQQHFHWGAPEMGGYMTATSLSRVLALTFILPLMIKLLHRPAHRIALPQDNDAKHDELDHEGRVSHRASHVGLPSNSSTSAPSPPSDSPYDSPSASSPSSPGSSTDDWVPLTQTERKVEHAWTARAKHLRLLHDSRFDLHVARISMLVAMVCYLGTASATTGKMFVIWTCLACLGAGAGAAISSLSVALLKNPKDAGRLFGASSMIGAIGQTVISPIMFTTLYQTTADTAYSWAIFVLAAGMFGTAFILLCCVRVRKPKSLPALPPRPAASATRRASYAP